MKQRRWIDALIILGMMMLVYLLCQPLGRRWTEGQEDMFSDEEGAYSLDTDSYFYLRKAKEYTEGGVSSVRFFSSRTEDALRTPVQSGAKDRIPTFLSAIAAYVWLFLKAIGIRVGIYPLAIHLCSVILASCTIPVFLFLRKRISKTASVLGAMLVTIAPPYFKHSMCGFFDTDALILLFALVSVLAVYECVLCASGRNKLINGAIALISTVLFSLTWEVFYVYTIIAVGTAAVALVGTKAVLGYPKEKKQIWIPGLTMVALLILAVILSGQNIVSTIISIAHPESGVDQWPSPAAFMGEMVNLRAIDAGNIWDIFMAVDSDFKSYFGGLFAVLFLIVSVGISVVRFIKIVQSRKNATGKEAEELFLVVAVESWLVGTLAMLFFGARFMEFAIIPASFIIALGFDRTGSFLLSEKRSQICRRSAYVLAALSLFMVLSMWKPVGACVLSGTIMVYGFWGSRLRKDYALPFLFAMVILAAPVQGAWLVTEQSFPHMDKPTSQAMDWIKNNTDENAIVADFWSLGYAYQYYGQRRTLGDGGTYNGAYFYWLGNMLTTDDSRLSAGIARMLQAGGIDASNYAVELTGNKQEAASLLKKILPCSKEEAKEYLQTERKYTDEIINKLLSYTHPDYCPDIYLITSYDMVRLSSILDYYKSWDFTGKTTVNDVPNSFWYGNQSIIKPEEGQTISCSLWKKGYPEGYVSMTLEKEGVSCSLSFPDGTQSELVRVVYYKDGTVLMDKKEVVGSGNNTLPQLAVVVMEENSRLSFVVCNEAMVDSTLLKLYLLGKTDQQVFEKVFEDEIPEWVSGEPSSIQRKIGTANTREYVNCGIIVWKVNSQ